VTVRPLLDRIHVRPAADRRLSPGGIVLPEIRRERMKTGHLVPGEQKTREGVVTAAGPKAGDVQIGDRVLFYGHVGFPTVIDGEELLVMKNEDILGIFD